MLSLHWQVRQNHQNWRKPIDVITRTIHMLYPLYVLEYEA